MSDANEKAKKGAGTTISAILFILILVIFAVVYIGMVNDHIKTKRIINIEDAALLRSENTFYLLNSSLSTTWFISSVQSVFRAGQEGVGCGFTDDEDKQVGKDMNDIEAGYWYQADPKRSKPTTCINSMPKTGKKYGERECNPMICIPSEENLRNYLVQKMEPYHNIKLIFNANENDITLADTDEETIKSQFFVEGEKIASLTSHKIKVKDIAFGTEINSYPKYESKINTYLGKMLDSGKIVVQMLYLFGGNMQEFINRDGYEIRNMNSENYKNYIKTNIDMIITAQSVAGKFEVVTDYKAFELYYSTDKNWGNDYYALILHYDADVKIIEGATSTSNPIPGVFQWPTESRQITSCFGPRTPPATGASGYHAGIDIAPKNNANDRDDIFAAYDGEVVQVNTGCNEGSDAADRACGGSYGNYVRIKHEINGEIYYSFYGHLQSVDVQKNDRVNKNEKIGVMGTTGVSTGIHLHFGISKSSNEDPCKYMNCGESTYKKCIVTDISTSYSGYYYHDEDENKFEKRPISLVFGVEDYIPVLSCSWGGNDPKYKLFAWTTPGDMACCGNKLWVCCNGGACPEIKNFPDDRKIADGGTIDDPSYCMVNIKCQAGSFSEV